MLDNFVKEYAKYESRIFAPFDDLPLTEEEIEKLEDEKAVEGDRQYDRMKEEGC